MNTLEPRRVHEPRGVARDQRPGAYSFGTVYQPALGQRLGAVAHQRRPVQHRRDQRVPLEMLKRDVGIEHRIPVVEPGHETERDQVVGQRIDETAAELFVLQRKAQGVDDTARLHAAGRYLPQLLDADRIHLRTLPVVQPELPHQRFGQVAADAVGENRDLGANIHTRLERGLALAMLVDAAIAGADADDAIAIEEDFGGGKAGEDVDAFRLDQAAEPLDEPVQRDEVVAVILEEAAA